MLKWVIYLQSSAKVVRKVYIVAESISKAFNMLEDKHLKRRGEMLITIQCGGEVI